MTAAPFFPEAFPAHALQGRLGPRPFGKSWAIYLPAQLGQARGPPEGCSPASSEESGFPGAPREPRAAQPAAGHVEGRVWRLSRDSRGSREVQRALEAAGSDAGRMALALELRGRIWVAMQCPHANHVVQKCITSMPPQCSQFILDELLSKGVVNAAQHKYGCRIIQRLLEHLVPAQVEELRESLLASVHRMSRHQYGNYVMQHLIEHGSAEHQQRLVQELCDDVAGLGSNLYGAAVIGVALARVSPEDQLALARAIANAPSLIERMSSTRHGHLVVKRTIVALEGTELEAQVSARVAANVKAMAAGRYGRVLAASVGLLPTAIEGGSDAPVDEA